MEPDIKAEAEGTFELDAIEQIFNINTLWVEYKNIEWENDDPFKVEFFTDSTHLANFNLSNEGASNLTGNGYLLGNGNQNLSFSMF